MTKNFQVRCTEESRDVINRLAEYLYSCNEVILYDMGIHRPSTKLAIDYLLNHVLRTDGLPIPYAENKNNLWRIMLINSMEEE